MPYTYQAYGIPINSTIELVALASASETITGKSILVEQGLVPDALQQPAFEQTAFYSYNSHEFIYDLPNVARYYITHGEQIIIEPLCDNWDKILLYFYGNCLAIILFQRNLLPFHVSGVFIAPTKVLLFAAHSRTGKSTTALMLQHKGYAPFTDDTALLNIENDICYAQASYPIMRLWQNTINIQTLLAETDKKPTLLNNDKYAFSFHGKFCTQNVEVSGIVFLEEAGTEINIKPLKPAQAMPLLGSNIYRKEWLNGMKKYNQPFELLTNIARILPTWKATRPTGIPSYDSFADCIEQQIILKRQSVW